jgi:hypothetical protein
MGFVPDPVQPPAETAPSAGSFVPDKGQPKQPDQKKLGAWSSAGIRPIVGGAIDTVSFVPDFAVSLVNTIANAGEKAVGHKPTQAEQVPMPSSYFHGQLDKYTTAPTTTSGKVAEGVSETLAAGGKSLGTLMGQAPRLIGKAAKAVGHAVENGLTKVTTAAAEQAHNAGIKLSPSYVGGSVAKGVQAAAGGAGKVDAVISEQNVSRLDELAKTSVGLHPETELSDLNFNKLRKENYAKYDTLGGTGQMAADPLYEAAVSAAGGRFAQRSSGFGGGYRYESVAAEKANYTASRNNPVTAQEAIDEVRALRATSRANLKTYDPEKNALGATQRQIADAIDARLDRHAQAVAKTNAKAAAQGPVRPGTAMTKPGTILPRAAQGATQGAAGVVGSGASASSDAMTQARALFTPDAYKAYVMARENLAKIATVEDALDPAGHIIAPALARAWDGGDGVKLTGGLKVIAETATHFPNSVKSLAKTGGQGIWSPLDFLVGGTGLIAHNPKAAAIAIARPIARAALTTKTVQREMLGKRTAIGSVSKAAVRGAGIRGSEALQEDKKKDDEE